LLIVSLAVIGLDQLTKYFIVKDLTRRMDGVATLSGRLDALYSKPEQSRGGLHFLPKGDYTVSDNFMRLRYAENPGAAWGLLRNVPERIRTPFFHVISWVAVGLILFYFFKLARGGGGDGWTLAGLSLVLGGAIGNYLDRLARGFVVDFIDVHWFAKAAWPSFNIADSAICVGAALILLESFRRKGARAPATAQG
jgi:signal peptidase II